MSIFLDLLRFVAAVVVVVGHFTEPYFSQGWPDLVSVASCAVAVFFVLSGFVISFVTRTKEKHAIDYAVARISRLYSVLVPAIVVSGIVLYVGYRLDPEYVGQWTQASTNLPFLRGYPILRFLAQTGLSLSFLNSIHDHEGYPAMNSPIWSLSYEAGYYVLFGVFLFCRGTRRIVLLALGAALYSGGILRLLPVWLAGVIVHKITLGLPSSRWRFVLGITCLVGVLAGCVCWPMFLSWSGNSHGPLMTFLIRGKGRAVAQPVFYYWGAVTSLLILGVAALDEWSERVLVPLERPIRWCAGHTFSLYLFHFPLLVLAYVTLHYNRSSRPQQAMVLAGVLGCCVLLSKISEEKKLWWRASVRSAFRKVFPAVSVMARS